MKLRGKVNLAVIAACGVGLVLACAGAYKVLTDEAVESSARDARIIIEQASAIRTYTAESIRPLLETQMKVQFLPHSIPSYAAQTNFRLVQKKLPEYSYREPTLNPTNINDRAVEWESDIINDFRDHPENQETMVIRYTPVGKFLTLSRPLKVSSTACLVCHSTPDAAPKTMVALYGSQNGFGWKLGDVIGAQVVSIPLAVPLQRAYNTLFLLIAALGGVFIVILLIVDALLRTLVVRPVVGISAMASDVSMGKLDAPEYVRRSDDEIGSLATSFNRMRRSLQNAMKMLDEEQP
jgi:HAMP domain-containing protein